MNQTTNLKLTDIVSASTQNIVSDMGGEKVMLSVENGNYYNLGVIGGHIWDALASPTTIAQLVDSLLAEFEVDRKQCEADVTAFLSHLQREGLIVVHGENTGFART